MVWVRSVACPTIRENNAITNPHLKTFSTIGGKRNRDKEDPEPREGYRQHDHQPAETRLGIQSGGDSSSRCHTSTEFGS